MFGQCSFPHGKLYRYGYPELRIEIKFQNDPKRKKSV